MKNALVNGESMLASPNSPPAAICSSCGGVVALRNRQGSYFWRHVKLPLGGCSPVLDDEPMEEGADDVTDTGNLEPWARQVGNFIIELQPDEADRYGHHLKLRSLSAEETGGPSGMIIYLSEVRPLTRVLLDAVADLVGLAVGDQEEK